MDLPASIRIGPHDIKVVRLTHPAQWARRPGRTAGFSSWSYEITVAPDNLPLSDLVDALWHEINHGIAAVYHLQDGDTEERRCSIMGTAMAALVRDNPDLFAWMIEAAQRMVDEGQFSSRVRWEEKLRRESLGANRKAGDTGSGGGDRQP